MEIQDDPELLELMLRDSDHVPDLYRPTNYWLNYEKLLVPELRSLGLRDFRRRKNSVLTSFGATDLLPSSIFLHHLPVWKPRRHSVAKRFLQLILQLKTVEETFEKVAGLAFGATLQDLRMLCYEFAKCYGESRGARSLLEFEASTVGNPEDIFIEDGKQYTTSLLNYYIQYAYCCRYVDFSIIVSICEIGSGAGKQIEVIRKLHPNIDFYVFDVPPQLYLCEQYLSALFHDSVVSYRETRTMRNVPKNHNGSIFIFGNWKLPELSELKYDLFWNSASFQEMEPNVVLNYLRYANQQTNRFAFLNECMDGVTLAASEGEHGVLERTTLEHYKMGLKDFQIQNMSTSIYLPGLGSSPYAPVPRMHFSFWSKNKRK
jgi:putative sugar O-methyltransferase